MQNPRLVLLVIALLFFGPLLLAVMMRSDWWDFRPDQMSNRGVLIRPPLTLPLPAALHGAGQTGAAGRWTMVHVTGAECGDGCLHALAGLRQVHLATGRHKPEVSLWLISDKELADDQVRKIHGIYPEIEVVHDQDSSSVETLNTITGGMPGESAPDARGFTFLMDPSANIILGYAPGYDPDDLSQDLDRLLTWSARPDTKERDG